METTVELLSENAVTFVLMTPILWSLQRITWEHFFIGPESDHLPVNKLVTGVVDDVLVC